MKLKYTTMINKYITTMAALTLSFGANAQTNTPEQKLPRPNVLFIVVDDLAGVMLGIMVALW